MDNFYDLNDFIMFLLRKWKNCLGIIFISVLIFVGTRGGKLINQYINQNENNNYETFLPREIENNKVEYVLTYKDCSEKVYDEITMYVMAGRLINENHKYGDVEQIPGMKQFGVEIEVNNRVDEAMEQMRDNINIMSRANQYSKQK